MTNSTNPSRILVYRMGSLGDTIVALPAMRAIREFWPNSHLTLLCDKHPRRSYVFAGNVIDGTSIFNDMMYYYIDTRIIGKLLQPIRMISLLRQIKKGKYGSLVYLAYSWRSNKMVARDRYFFKLAGIENLYGMEGFPGKVTREWGMRPPEVAHETDALLSRLKTSGIATAQPGRAQFDFELNSRDFDEVDQWIKKSNPDNGRPWLGIGPGGKQAENCWPYERYITVVQELIREFDVWPIVFGGPDDLETSSKLVHGWGRGSVATENLSIRANIAAMSRCKLFIGNDTGSMHMAAASGCRCVALHSTRNPPGRWAPYGDQNVVIRGTDESFEGRERSILTIGPDEVVQICKSVFPRESIQIHEY